MKLSAFHDAYHNNTIFYHNTHTHTPSTYNHNRCIVRGKGENRLGENWVFCFSHGKIKVIGLFTGA